MRLFEVYRAFAEWSAHNKIRVYTRNQIPYTEMPCLIAIDLYGDCKVISFGLEFVILGDAT